jgi:hypothetical protein
MEDVLTIRISRRAVRWFLIGVAVFLVLGFVIPVVLANVGRSHAPSRVHVTPVQAP